MLVPSQVEAVRARGGEIGFGRLGQFGAGRGQLLPGLVQGVGKPVAFLGQFGEAGGLAVKPGFVLTRAERQGTRLLAQGGQLRCEIRGAGFR